MSGDVKCTAVVAVTIEVPVAGIYSSWSINIAHKQARDDALKRVRSHYQEIGRVSAIRVVSVATHGELETIDARGDLSTVPEQTAIREAAKREKGEGK